MSRAGRVIAKKPARSRRGIDWFPYLLMAPGLLLVLFVTVYPMVFAIDYSRPETEPVEDPASSTTCEGSQNAASRRCRSRDTGRAPSSVSSGTRSSHFPMSARSSGADGRGAGLGRRDR